MNPCDECKGSGKQTTTGRWKNERDREFVMTFYEDYRFTGVSAGVGTFSGSEIGYFERDCPACLESGRY